MRHLSLKSERAAAKEKGGSLARPTLKIKFVGDAQSVQRRSERILIWRSEAAVKVGTGLLTTL